MNHLIFINHHTCYILNLEKRGFREESAKDILSQAKIATRMLIFWIAYGWDKPSKGSFDLQGATTQWTSLKGPVFASSPLSDGKPHENSCNHVHGIKLYDKFSRRCKNPPLVLLVRSSRLTHRSKDPKSSLNCDSPVKPCKKGVLRIQKCLNASSDDF